MKIFEDPPVQLESHDLPSSFLRSSSSHSSATSSGKAVSFTSSTKTSMQNPQPRTPLRDKTSQSPGLTPKLKKSSKMILGSFRQSLKSPPPSHVRSMLANQDDEENVPNRRQTSREYQSCQATQQNKAPELTVNANSYRIDRTSATTPKSAGTLRRSLRATIQGDKKLSNRPERRSLLVGSNEIGVKRNCKASGVVFTSKLGPPQRVVPKTPNSLLRTEMEALDSASSIGTDQEESLLVSPPPGAVWNALNLSNNSAASTTALLVVSPRIASNLKSCSSSKNMRNEEHSTPLSPSSPDNETSHSGLQHKHLLTARRILVLETPRDITAEEDSNILEPASMADGVMLAVHNHSKDMSSSEENDIHHCVQTSTITGGTMDLIEVLSPSLNRKDKENLLHATPLSDSIPPTLLSRLNANRQTNPRRKDGGFQEREEIRFKQEVTRSAEKSEIKKTHPSRCNKTTITSLTSKKHLPKERSKKSMKKIPLDKCESTIEQGQIFQRIQKNTGEPTQAKKNNQLHKGGMAFEVPFEGSKKTLVSLGIECTKAKTHDETLSKTFEKPCDWADKQCLSFVSWLNFTINPEQEENFEGADTASGLRGLLIHRRLAGVRSKAAELFQGDTMRSIRMILLREISHGRLAVRADRDVTSDIQLRKFLASLVLSYTTPWLRMALEVMFDEIIEPVPLTPNGPKTYFGRMKVALESFVKQRFLSDNTTLSKFTNGRCNMPSGVFEVRYKAQMRCLVLSRIMILVFFLDIAKAENVLDNAPRLFAISSKIKSSRDVLIAICSSCLSAEGDIVKHLSRIGLKIHYEQDPIDEVDFKVSNLATDLRDGILLTRLTEIVVGVPFKSLMKSLRLPAMSRLQKKFNVGFAMTKLRTHGIFIADEINAHHIIDGHRVMVLALMWCIILHCCMTKLLSRNLVEQEIQDVVRSSKARSKVGKPCIGIDLPPVSDQSVLYDNSISPENILKNLLLRWSQAVCSWFGLRIYNFTTSFGDGMAICLLIHYYHPGLISLGEIQLVGRNLETLTPENARSFWRIAINAIKELGGVPSMFPVSDQTSPPDEQSMLLCLSYLCSRLMESSREIFATILIQAHYRRYQRRCLLEKKIIAAQLIFSIWIRHKAQYFEVKQRRYATAVRKLEKFVLSHREALLSLRNDRLDRERCEDAAIQIQRIFRGLRARTICYTIWEKLQAALMIQSSWRRTVAMWQLNNLRVRQDAATVVQSYIRLKTTRAMYLQKRSHAISMQKRVRGFLTRANVARQKIAAIVLQQLWRSYVVQKDKEYASTFIQKMWRAFAAQEAVFRIRHENDSARDIQKSWRGYFQRVSYFILLESTVMIQRRMRGHLSRRAFSFRRSQIAATAIQRIWRGFYGQIRFQIEFLDVICVQSVIRRYLTQKEKKRRLHSVLVLQCAFRSFAALQQRNVLRSAVRIQSIWRARKVRLLFVSYVTAACAMQRHWKGHAVRENIRRLSFASTVIQSNWRSYVIYSDYQFFKMQIAAATTIQTWTRRLLVRQRFLIRRFSCQVLQRGWRFYSLSRKRSEASRTVQTQWRCYHCKKQFRSVLVATVRLQSSIRVVLAKQTALCTRWRNAAIAIQRVWRGFLEQVRFQLLLLDVICVQSFTRKYIAVREFSRKTNATIVVQCAFRCAIARKQLLQRTLERHSIASVCVIRIQTAWRSWSARLKFGKSRVKCIIVQNLWRGYQVRRVLGKLSNAACVIQCNWRRYSIRCVYLLDLLILRSTVMIQAAVRMRQVQIEIQRRHFAGTVVQCWYRCVASKRWLSLLVEHKQRKKIEALAVTSIQRTVRGILARKTILNAHAAIKMVQALWRNYKRGINLKNCAIHIQSVIRCYITRERFESQKLACTAIQKMCKGHLARLSLLRMYHASIAVQSTWRAYVAHNKYLLDLVEAKSAIAIQATFRMYTQRMDFMIIKFAAHTLQRCLRGMLARIKMAIKHFAAGEIQKVWRGYNTISFDDVIGAIVHIQSIFRMACARLRFDELRIAYWADAWFRHRKAVLIQVAFRNFLERERLHRAAEIIQKSYRIHSVLKRIQLVSRGVISLQSMFRGWCQRKSRSKVVARVAHRIHKETMRAMQYPELQLGNRTDKALYLLQTSQSLTRIIDAVKELEASTRLSVVCCQVFTKANAANILLRLIQSCNRSVPHMELKEHILLTLENVSQYPSLVGSFAHRKYAEVFLDNVQVFRDKDGIFCLAVSLLDRILKADHAIATFCASHEHLKRLKEVFRVVNKRVNSREDTGSLHGTTIQRENKLKKRTYFDRDYFTRRLGKMINFLSELAALRSPHEKDSQVFTFL